MRRRISVVVGLLCLVVDRWEGEDSEGVERGVTGGGRAKGSFDAGNVDVNL